MYLFNRLTEHFAKKLQLVMVFKLFKKSFKAFKMFLKTIEEK